MMIKEISVMRPLLILLLVVYHSFLVYAGGWEQPVGFISIPLYKGIASWSYAFLLEAFTFISGYIYINTCHKKGIGSLANLALKKSKRLLLPMVIFGVIYSFFFTVHTKPLSFVYEVMNGAGHLWYLIMLFWCFIETWILLQIRISEKIKLLVIALFAIFCSWTPIPFRISTSFYYLFFFYLPVVFVDRRDIIMGELQQKPLVTMIISWSLFALVFILIRYVWQFPRSYESSSIVVKALLLSLNNAMQMIYSFLGLVAFYLTSLLISGTTELIDKDTLLVRIGNYCFGVYIFQQFVLKALYFKSPIPSLIGPYLLPWVGVVAALVISYLLVYIIRLSKMGRMIL